ETTLSPRERVGTGARNPERRESTSHPSARKCRGEGFPRGEGLLPCRLLSLALLALVLLAPAVLAGAVTINDNQPVVAETLPFTTAGTTDAPPGTDVAITIETSVLHTQVLEGGKWSLTIDHLPLPTGTYSITATIGNDSTTQLLRLQLTTPNNLQRQIPIDV